MRKQVILSLIGGVLILVNGILDFFYGFLPSWQLFSLVYKRMPGTLYRDGYVEGEIGIGFLVVCSALVMEFRRNWFVSPPFFVPIPFQNVRVGDEMPLGGTYSLILSLPSLIFFQGFIIGPILGIIGGGIEVSEWKYEIE